MSVLEPLFSRNWDCAQTGTLFGHLSGNTPVVHNKQAVIELKNDGRVAVSDFSKYGVRKIVNLSNSKQVISLQSGGLSLGSTIAKSDIIVTAACEMQSSVLLGTTKQLLVVNLSEDGDGRIDKQIIAEYPSPVTTLATSRIRGLDKLLVFVALENKDFIVLEVSTDVFGSYVDSKELIHLSFRHVISSIITTTSVGDKVVLWLAEGNQAILMELDIINKSYSVMTRVGCKHSNFMMKPINEGSITNDVPGMALLDTDQSNNPICRVFMPNRWFDVNQPILLTENHFCLPSFQVSSKKDSVLDFEVNAGSNGNVQFEILKRLGDKETSIELCRMESGFEGLGQEILDEIRKNKGNFLMNLAENNTPVIELLQKHGLIDNNTINDQCWLALFDLFMECQISECLCALVTLPTSGESAGTVGEMFGFRNVRLMIDWGVEKMREVRKKLHQLMNEQPSLECSTQILSGFQQTTNTLHNVFMSLQYRQKMEIANLPEGSKMGQLDQSYVNAWLEDAKQKQEELLSIIQSIKRLSLQCSVACLMCGCGVEMVSTTDNEISTIEDHEESLASRLIELCSSFPSLNALQDDFQAYNTLLCRHIGADIGVTNAAMLLSELSGEWDIETMKEKTTVLLYRFLELLGVDRLDLTLVASFAQLLDLSGGQHELIVALWLLDQCTHHEICQERFNDMIELAINILCQPQIRQLVSEELFFKIMIRLSILSVRPLVLKFYQSYVAIAKNSRLACRALCILAQSVQGRYIHALQTVSKWVDQSIDKNIDVLTEGEAFVLRCVAFEQFEASNQIAALCKRSLTDEEFKHLSKYLKLSALSALNADKVMESINLANILIYLFLFHGRIEEANRIHKSHIKLMSSQSVAFPSESGLNTRIQLLKSAISCAMSPAHVDWLDEVLFVDENGNDDETIVATESNIDISNDVLITNNNKNNNEQAMDLTEEQQPSTSFNKPVRLLFGGGMRNNNNNATVEQPMDLTDESEITSPSPIMQSTPTTIIRQPQPIIAPTPPPTRISSTPILPRMTPMNTPMTTKMHLPPKTPFTISKTPSLATSKINEISVVTPIVKAPSTPFAKTPFGPSASKTPFASRRTNLQPTPLKTPFMSTRLMKTQNGDGSIITTIQKDQDTPIVVEKVKRRRKNVTKKLATKAKRKSKANATNKTSKTTKTKKKRKISTRK